MAEAAHPQHPSTAPLESRLEFETLISDTSAALFALGPEETPVAVERTLGQVRRFFEADLCALLRVGRDPRVVNVRMASYGEGIAAVPPSLNLAAIYPWSWQRLIVERLPVRVARWSELPPEASAELPQWRAMGTRSALSLPLEQDGAVRHVIVLHTMRQERDWPDAFVRRLRVLGELLTSALERGALLTGLQAAEERVSVAADAAGAGLWVFDYASGEFWVSERTRAIFSFGPEEQVTAAVFLASVHPEDLGAVERTLWQRAPAALDYRIRRRDGQLRWLSSRGRPVQGPSGEVTRLTGSTVDVTDRMLAEEERQRGAARLAMGADLAGLAYYEIDYGRGAAFGDDRFFELFGVPPASRQGLQALHHWLDHLHPEDRPAVLASRESLHDGRLERLSTVYRYLHPLRGQVWIHHLAGVSARDAGGLVITTYGTCRDVTEQKRAEEEVSDLSRRLIGAHEDERAFLARELHDDVSQRLAVLAIDAGRLEHAAGDGALATGLRSVGAGLARLSEDVHGLAYRLHPSVLEELGLAEALRATCDRLGRPGALAIRLDLHEVPAGLGKEGALCLFRVAQEALNNIVRHAGARVATVSLMTRDGGLCLTIRDDGIGFDPASPRPRKTLGLASMRERVRLLRGTLDVQAAPGLGTAISAWLPGEGGPP